MKLLDILTSPWCIVPEKLLEIQEIYRTHLRGEKIDIKGIETAVNKKPDENEKSRYDVINGVAVIPIHGVIAKRMNLFTQISGGVSTELLARDIREAIGDPEITGIILDIDSPGGTVDGTQDLAEEIYRAREQKPIVAFSDGMIASAAYWNASAAREIWISNDTVDIGSIGVVASHRDYSKYEEKLGVKTTEVYAGKYKRIYSQYRPLSKEGKQTIQDQVDYIYSVFVNDVARNRGKSVDAVLKNMADGRIFIGKQSIKNGLVDGVSTMADLITRMVAGDVTGSGNQKVPKEVKTMTTKELREEYPNECKAIFAEGKEAGEKAGHETGYEEGVKKGAEVERERIKSVEDQLVAGHEDLIAELKYDGKTTGPEAAVKIITANKRIENEQLENIKADAPKPVPHAEPPQGGEGEANEPAFLDLVGTYQKDKGCSKVEAIQAVARENPKAHEKYLADANA